jgi:integrase/recombinase XerD
MVGSQEITYIRTVEDFADYFHRPPDQLGPEHVREYQAQLFTKKHLSPNTVIQRLAALRFFYIKTLRNPGAYPRHHTPKRSITALYPEPVALPIDSAGQPFHRLLLMAAYSTGLRRAELAHLKVSNIDSLRVVTHVQGGKGRKDRLEALRDTGAASVRSPTRQWLFPGNRWRTGDCPIDIKLVWQACRAACAGLTLFRPALAGSCFMFRYERHCPGPMGLLC